MVQEHPKIVVAGYGSWAMAAANPAQLVVETLEDQPFPGCTVIPIKMPVDTHGLYNRVEGALAMHNPDAWIGVGVAPSATMIRAEMIGVNWRHFSVPDAEGVTTDLLPIIEGGPDAYSADLPNKALVDAIMAAKIPAALSFSAGTHLCNQMLYTVRHLVKTKGYGTLSGFIHVPQTPENVALQMQDENPVASMSLDTMAYAVALCVEHVSEQLRAPRLRV